MFIDELQYVEEDQLAVLIGVLHRCAQRKLPVALLGAGPPQFKAISSTVNNHQAEKKGRGFPLPRCCVTLARRLAY
jgi:hypothetical protein